MVFGLILLSYATISSLLEHKEDFGLSELLISMIIGSITILILATFSHKHHHDKDSGVKGLIISESFHSLIDGAVIGATYLVNPILGSAATLGIIIHEFPKIIGTLALFRSFGLSTRKTILYGALAQGGAPIAAMFIYVLGKQVDHEQFHALEIASISSLAAIIIWIIYLEIKHHLKHPHKNIRHSKDD
jgi:zinc transporter ZupT